MNAERKRADERRRLYLEEIAMFELKPWEVAPVHAGGDPPPANGTMRALTWPLAHERRQKLLEADPHRYDLVDFEDDDEQEPTK